MLLKLNNRFIIFSIIIKLHITEISTVQCTQECSINQKVWGPDICCHCLSNLQRLLVDWILCLKQLNKSKYKFLFLNILG